MGARRQCLACLVYCLLVALPASPDVAADTDASNTSSVALFPAASNAHREGFVRVINRAEEAGEIQVAAIDDAGMRIEGAVLAIGPNETRHFNSGDLEDGNPEKGLSGGTGPGRGDWRLELGTNLDVEVLAYIRTTDGFLTAMHDVVAPGRHGYRAAIFNPGRNRKQQSLLRLINPGDGEIAVRVSGTDDAGLPGSDVVTLMLPPRFARTVSAAELESAVNRVDAEAAPESWAGLDGELGEGTGKWQLLITADDPIVVMSLLLSPTGHLTNLSTAPHRIAAGAGTIRYLPENTAAGEAFGEPVTADLQDGAGRRHDLEGIDAASFDIEPGNGQLLADEEVAYDFESRRAYALVVAVSNDSGRVVRIPVTVEVTDVDEPPGRPEPPEVEGVSSRSVRVTWVAPSNTGPEITDYDVGYRREGAREYTDAEHEGVEREVEIGYLRAGADYEFRVRASNDEGIGEWSEPTIGRARTGGGGGGGGTPPPPPPPPPQANDPPAFEEGAEATRELLENTPADRNIGQPVRATDPEGRTLTYRLEGADAGSFNLLGQTGQLQTRNGVDYNFEGKSRYELIVRADDGEGGSATIRVTVALLDEDGEAPEQPPLPLLTNATTTSLTVTWTAPANAGPEITDYEVSYRILNSGAYTDWPHDGAHTVATIENLDHSTQYQVHVRAQNGEGTSPYSRRMLAATLAPHSPEPVWVRGTSQEEDRGAENGTPVTLIDRLFGPDGHGTRITRTFMDTVADADHARYAQTDGGRTYRLDGRLITGYSDFLMSGYIRHAQNYGDGIVWTASDLTTPYRSGDFDWFVEDGRPFKKTARAFANWMKNRNVLFVTSLENTTVFVEGSSRTPVYCDDFRQGGFDGQGWVPLCGELDDYIAHSGTGLSNTVFAGSIERGLATGAIRSDGVFAGNTIHVESPDGSTSHATAVLAAHATELKYANPTWSASRLRQELMRLAREQEFDYFVGETNEFGTAVNERRTIRLILPAFAPGTGNRFPQFSSAATHSAVENQTAAGTVEAADEDAEDTVTGYAVVGGADAARFTISDAGALQFKTAPDYEAPTDVDGPEPDSKAGDNDYIVVVQASSGSGNRLLTAQQRITVTITDETE